LLALLRGLGLAVGPGLLAGVLDQPLTEAILFLRPFARHVERRRARGRVELALARAPERAAGEAQILAVHVVQVVAVTLLAVVQLPVAAERALVGVVLALRAL